MKQKTFTYNFHERRLSETPLEELLSEFKNKEALKFLEVGSCEGQSTNWFIETFLGQKDSMITCIDPFYQGHFYDEPHPELREKIEGVTVYDLFKNNVLDCNINKVLFFRGKSSVGLKLLKNRYYDFVYIDGNHKKENVAEDCNLAWPLLKENGLILFDDYEFDEVKNSVDEFLLKIKMKHLVMSKLADFSVYVRPSLEKECAKYPHLRDSILYVEPNGSANQLHPSDYLSELSKDPNSTLEDIASYNDYEVIHKNKMLLIRKVGY